MSQPVTMATNDPIKPTSMPLITDPRPCPFTLLSPLDITDLGRPSSSSSVSSSETLFDPQYTSDIIRVFHEKHHSIPKDTIFDPQPLPLPSPPAGCPTSESSVYAFGESTEHMPEKDGWAILSLGPTPVADDDYEAFTDVPLSPLTIPQTSLTSFTNSSMDHLASTSSFNFMLYPQYGTSSWYQPVDVYSAVADEYNVAYNNTQGYDASSYPYDRAVNNTNPVTDDNVLAPHPQPAIPGEPPSFLQPAPGLLGVTNTQRSLWVRRLERRARGGNTNSSAHPTTAPQSPLSPRQGLSLVDERSPLTKPHPSEFSLLRTPNHPPFSPGRRQNLDDLLRDDHTLTKLSSRHVAFDLGAPLASTDSSALRTPPPPKLGHIELPPDEPIHIHEEPETGNPITVVDSSNLQSSPMLDEKVHPFSGYVPLNQEEAWQSRLHGHDTPKNTTDTDVSTLSSDRVDPALSELLLYLRDCSAATFGIQRSLSSYRPLNYDVSVLCKAIAGVLSRIHAALQRNTPSLDELPETSRSSVWLNGYTSVISSLQRNLIGYRRMATLITLRTIRSRNVDPILSKFGRYEMKFRDLLARLTKLHGVSEILVLHSALDASRSFDQENVGTARTLRETQFVELRRQRAYRHELREQIRMKKRAMRSYSGL